MIFFQLTLEEQKLQKIHPISPVYKTVQWSIDNLISENQPLLVKIKQIHENMDSFENKDKSEILQYEGALDESGCEI